MQKTVGGDYTGGGLKWLVSRVDFMELSKKERLALSYQLRILESLYPDDAEHYAQYRKAIEQGYTLHYDWMTEHLYPELSETKCREVLDILDMYRSIHSAIAELPEDDPLKTHHLGRFPGFDGNNETLLMSYVQYFVVDLGRYSELRADEYPYFNSHCPMLDTYEEMLGKWKVYKRSFRLSREQLADILGA